MKFCAYMTFCLCLPLVLLAEEGDKDGVKAAPEGENPATAEASDPGFERFKTILDRMPFGQPPPGFNPDAPGGAADGSRGAAATAEAAAEAAASEVEQQILSSVSVSMLNRSPDGSVFVGFTDKSVQPPRNYLLKVGEKREGCDWLVVSAEPEDRQVKLSKGGVEATLKLGGGGGPSEEKGKDGKEGGDAAKNAPMRPGIGIGNRRMPPPAPPAAAPGAEGNLTGLALARARHQQRLEQQKAEEEQKRQAAEQAKKERDQEKLEREQAAEERKAQLAQLMQIQEELRAAREEKQAEAERRAAVEAQQQGDPQEANPN